MELKNTRFYFMYLNVNPVCFVFTVVKHNCGMIYDHNLNQKNCLHISSLNGSRLTSLLVVSTCCQC